MQDVSQELPPGPEPRWFVYVAAVICGGFFSGIVAEGLSIGLAAMLGEGWGWLALEGGVLGLASGAVWGIILAWAVRLKLSIIAIILSLGTLLVLGPVFTQILLATSGDPEATAPVWGAIFLTLGQVIVFWTTLLAIALPPRLRYRRKMREKD